MSVRQHSLLALLSFFVILLARGCQSQGPEPVPNLIGSFPLSHAGFVEVYDDQDTSDEVESKTLYITTFDAANLISNDPVYRLRSPGSKLDSVDTWDQQLELMGGEETAVWPNYPVNIPKDLAGFNGLLQTSGFIPPGKTDGQLEVYNVDQDPPTGPWNIASLDSRTYSYHWVVWRDIDGDGLLDALAARFHVNTVGTPDAELVWLRNPGGLADDGTGFDAWEQSLLIAGGPDVFFEFIKLDADGKTFDVMVTSELWTERIMLYYVEDVPGAWADPVNIMSVVIDDAPGVPFEAHAVDINLDGTLEIMASAFDESTVDGGHLWGYLMPADWRDPNWERITLAEGFTANNYVFGNSMTPGKQRLFWPSEGYQNQNSIYGPMKPWISLSGDDDGKHYVLTPVSEERVDYTYDVHLIIDSGDTTSGTMAVLDIDGDGYTEIISATYSQGKVYVHSYAP